MWNKWKKTGGKNIENFFVMYYSLIDFLVLKNQQNQKKNKQG